MKRAFAIIFGLLFAQNVLAAGMSVTPTRLFFQSTAKKETVKQLEIKNISATPLVYNLYSDELGDQITLSPNILRLDPGQNEKVSVAVKMFQSGVYLTDISILAQALDKREFNAVAGTKIPVEIQVAGAPVSFFIKLLPWLIVLLIFIIISLVSWLAVRKRKQQSFWQRIGSQVNLLHHKKPWWTKFIK